MTNLEKEIVGEILRPAGLSASRLGLRFDRVVLRVLADLRTFAETTAPGDAAVLVTISAPIRLPAKTVQDLKLEIGARVAAGAPGEERRTGLRGNDVRLKLLRNTPARAPRLVGFVHKANSEPQRLLDLAERWVRAQA